MRRFCFKFHQINLFSFLLVVILGSIVLADTNGVWHNSDDIRPGIFGFDEQVFTGGYFFINPVTFNKSIIYNGTELNDLYVNENQVNSISSAMIIDGSIISDDVNISSVQKRVLGKCNPGNYVREITQDGSVICEEASEFKTKDFFCRGTWYLRNGEFFCNEPLPIKNVVGTWTGSSGDCDRDTWSNIKTVSCPAGYVIYNKEIRRQARWRSGSSWSYDTSWVPNDSNWNARTSINCDLDSCSYRTKGVPSKRIQTGTIWEGFYVPNWAGAYCGGDQWYTRMIMKLDCRSPEFKENY